jgi:hypothetical protein
MKLYVLLFGSTDCHGIWWHGATASFNFYFQEDFPQCVLSHRVLLTPRSAVVQSGNFLSAQGAVVNAHVVDEAVESVVTARSAADTDRGSVIIRRSRAMRAVRYSDVGPLELSCLSLFLPRPISPCPASGFVVSASTCARCLPSSTARANGIGSSGCMVWRPWIAH